MRVLNKKIWPYQVKINKHPDRNYVTDENPQEIWCRKNLKSKNWYSFGYTDVTFVFKRHEDAVLFSLHWL
jgi:hypothetical protein